MGFRSPAVSQAPGKSGTRRVLPSIALAAGFPIEPEREYSALLSSCSRLCHHPVAGALQESDGHRFASFVILHSDDGCLRRLSFPSCLNPHPIVELQRQGRKKNSVLWAPKFHNSCLAQTGSG